MRIGRILFSPDRGGSPAPHYFSIKWSGEMSGWQITNVPRSLPLSAATAAVDRILNLDAGRAFLVPTLSAIVGQELSRAKVGSELTVHKFEDGADSGIFKVTAQVNMGKIMDVSFCLNVSRHPANNKLHENIFENLSRLWKIDPRYVVRPLAFGRGEVVHEGQKIELAVFPTIWEENYAQVNMFSTANGLQSLDSVETFNVIGERRIYLSPPLAGQDNFVGDRIEGKIAEGIVRTLTHYFNPQTGEAIRWYMINIGDFIYRPGVDDDPSIKLVTARKFSPPPNVRPASPVMNGSNFLYELLFHCENSVFQQEPARRSMIFTFTPADVYRGVKKALVQKYGTDEAFNLFTKLIKVCLFRLEYSDYQPESKMVDYRTRLIIREFKRLAAEDNNSPAIS